VKRALIVVAVILLGLPVQARADEAVRIVDNAFDPSTVEATLGETIAWTHDGATDHTVTADDGSFDSELLGAGQRYEMRPRAAGRIAYHCQIHGGPGGEGMSGTIVVAAATVPRRLPGTGEGDIPATGLVMFALSLVALGVWLACWERLVYPERR